MNLYHKVVGLMPVKKITIKMKVAEDNINKLNQSTPIFQLQMQKRLIELSDQQFVDPFRPALILPPFFEKNLQDPARVVKLLKDDPQANIRIFYYQYLKLCFQSDEANNQLHLAKFQQIINDESFSFVFKEQDDPTVYNDHQFKFLLAEILQLLTQNVYSVDSLLQKLPFTHTVLLYFFRSFLILTGRAQYHHSYIDREELLSCLSQYFQVEIQRHDKCIKFEETDIFIYEEDPSMVYMAYMDYNNIDHEDIEERPDQEGLQIVKEDMNANISNKLHHQDTNTGKTKVIINQSYISSDFVDYTSGDADALTALIKKDKIVNEIIEKPREELKATKSHFSGKGSKDKHVGFYEEDLQHEKLNRPISSGITVAPTTTQHSEKSYQGKFNQPINLTRENSLINKINQVEDLPIEEKKKTYPPINYSPAGQTQTRNIEKTYSNPHKYLQQTQVKQGFNRQPIIDSYRQNSRPSYENPQLYSKLIQNQYGNLFESPKPHPPSPVHYEHPNHHPAQPKFVQSYTPPMIIAQPKQVRPVQGSYVNVSIQFTNSWIMKVMNEPHRSNVRMIRQRARKFRSSINPYKH